MRGERLLLLLGCLVVPGLILAAEGSLALVERRDPGEAESESSGIDRLHRYSEAYGWEPRPGRYVEDGRVITINDNGYRGEAAAEMPTPGRRRVVVLGDSVAFGLYASDHETYAAALEDRDSGFEVLNLAVQGYGPDQALRRLEGLGLSLRPDVVVLGFCLGNDFADAMLPTFLFDEAHPKPFFTLEDGALVKHDAHLRLPFRERTALWLEENSRLYRRLTSTPEREKERGRWLERRRLATQDREATLSLVTRLVTSMRDVAASQGAAFLVLLHPDRPSARAERWAEEFAARLAAEGLRTIDLLDRYAERGLTFDEVTLDGLGHLSPPGHAETASIVLEALRDEGQQPTRVSLMGTPHPRPR